MPMPPMPTSLTSDRRPGNDPTDPAAASGVVRPAGIVPPLLVACQP